MYAIRRTQFATEEGKRIVRSCVYDFMLFSDKQSAIVGLYGILIDGVRKGCDIMNVTYSRIIIGDVEYEIHNWDTDAVNVVVEKIMTSIDVNTRSYD